MGLRSRRGRSERDLPRTTIVLGVRSPADRVPGVPVWTARRVASEIALAAAYNAAFPRLARRGRWVSRLGPRGLATYVLVRAVERYVTLTYVIPFLLGVIERQQAWRAELAERLGREPTEDEVREDALRRTRDEHGVH